MNIAKTNHRSIWNLPQYKKMEEYIPREGKKNIKSIIQKATGSERSYLRELFKGKYTHKYDILRSIGREKNIITGIFEERPGIFCIDRCYDARHQLSSFFKNKNLPDLAQNILMHGKRGKSTNGLITGDPATKEFIASLKKVMQNDKKLTAQLAKLLKKLYASI